MFYPNYPNLELLAYKAEQILQSDKEFVEKCKTIRLPAQPELDVQVFPQIWGSTCMGFDSMPDGSPALGGCAMTKAYTTVFREARTDIYIIFFGDRPCYKVNNATTEFFTDLKNRNMAPLSKAKLLY